MSELAQPIPLARRDAFPALGARLAVTWEAVAWAAVIVLAFGFRLWDLGSRAMHHDESMHAYYGFQLLQGNGYEHSPMLHGPFQFFGTAATFFLAGGASDVSARILPALFGGVLAVLPLFFRRQLGRAGALVAAALIAFSPALLYYSRFAREDVYAAAFTLGIVICIWRYIDERKPSYLYASAALLALSFATKETTFIFVAILLLFLNLWVAADFAAQSREGRRGTAGGIYFLLYLPFAWLLATLWPFIGTIRGRLRLDDRHPAMDVLLVVGTLAAPQFAAAVELPLKAVGIEIGSAAQERAAGVPAVISLLAASAIVGLAWKPRIWLTAAACFYVPYALLFTAFLTDIDGFGGGMWESLDFWLGQQDVGRSTQPDFYYLMFWPAYEYLALAFGGPALLYFCLRGGPRPWLFTAITVLALLFLFGADSFGGGAFVEIAQYVMLPVAAVAIFAAVRGTMFERFLVFWTAASLVAYSVVGEKMPWLSVHTALPLIVLAGYTIERLFAERRHTASGEREGGGAETRGYTWRPIAVPAALVFALLAVLSLRTAILATYDHGDVPREFLFYAQTSPDVPDVVARINHIAEASGRGKSLRIQVDKADTWPWAWYLRDYNVSFESMGAEFVPEAGALVMVTAENEGTTTEYLHDYQEPQPYTLRWWFPEEYRGIGEKDNVAEAVGEFAADLGKGDTWNRWWGFWFHRDILPRGGIEGRLLVPLEFEAVDVAQVPSTPAGREEAAARPTADLEGREIIGELGSQPGQMLLPMGLAVDGVGNIYVVDTGNSRIQKFDARGTPAGMIGTAGGEPGQFNQPSDIAVDAAGNVYVVDTWNHRIQKFAPDPSASLSAGLTPVTVWGQPTRDLINPGPDQLWAPRGIAIDHDGNILVADTGTNRIRRYGADGTHLGDFGRWGREPGEFDGPSGIAVGPDGSIYVADAGNARVQKFDATFQFVAAWPIEDWAERQLGSAPQIEALPDGRLIATDSTHRRLLLIGGDGRVTARLDTVIDVPLFSADGVAFDAERAFVYVTDGLAGHVRRFPFTDFALR